MLDDEGEEEYLEDVGGEVVVEEEGSVEEEVGQVVQPVAEEEHVRRGGEARGGAARRGRRQPARAQRPQRQQRAERRHGARARVPRHYVPDQMDLSLHKSNNY